MRTAPLSLLPGLLLSCFVGACAAPAPDGCLPGDEQITLCPPENSEDAPYPVGTTFQVRNDGPGSVSCDLGSEMIWETVSVAEGETADLTELNYGCTSGGVCSAAWSCWPADGDDYLRAWIWYRSPEE